MNKLSVSIVLFTSASAFGQTPPYSSDWRLEDRPHIGDVQFPSIHPAWIRISHMNADWFVLSALDVGGAGFIPNVAEALYDDSGILMASVTFPLSNRSSIVYGAAWLPGDVGSPVMLLPNQYYFIGVAPGGTVFHNGFAADMFQQNGLVRVIVSPTPGSVIPFAVAGLVAQRRRRESLT